MSALDSLRRVAAEQSRDRLLAIGVLASVVWLALVALFVWLGAGAEAQSPAGWLLWLLGVLVPLGFIWFGVWSAHNLALLRHEAAELRVSLREMRAASAQPGPTRIPPPPARPRSAVPAPDNRQAPLDLDAQPLPELVPAELFLALNFPDGPEDHEAIRCLRLALTDPQLSRLIRAGQDVVTLLAGRGVYMDDLPLPEPDPALWSRFAQGERGDGVSALAGIADGTALTIAAQMMHEDEVFRDVAHHFLRHFDRMLSRRAETDNPEVLAALTDSRSGRAFILLAQVSGVLNATGAETEADADA